MVPWTSLSIFFPSLMISIGNEYVTLSSTFLSPVLNKHLFPVSAPHQPGPDAFFMASFVSLLKERGTEIWTRM